jgi:hypothetical protein
MSFGFGVDSFIEIWSGGSPSLSCNEGKERFEKATGIEDCCADDDEIIDLRQKSPIFSIF